jgi:hypothetical protein
VSVIAAHGRWSPTSPAVLGLHPRGGPLGRQPDEGRRAVKLPAAVLQFRAPAIPARAWSFHVLKPDPDLRDLA